MLQWVKMSQLMGKYTLYYRGTKCHRDMGSIPGRCVQLQVTKCHTDTKFHIPGNRGWT
jgi:hypothetical protein